MTTTGQHPYIAGDTPRGRAEQRVLAAIARAHPDKDIRYLFGGFVVLPKNTPVVCASTLETLWEKTMTGPSPTSTVPGTVLLHNNELTEGPA